MPDLQDILGARHLSRIRGWFYDGRNFPQLTKATAHIENGRIKEFTKGGSADLIVPDDTIIIPGGIDTHVHGRDAYDILPGQPGDQTHKEDAYTLALALAHGGATYGVCMFNFRSPVTTDGEYWKEIKWMNSELRHRRKPIMSLAGHMVVKPNEPPTSSRTMWDKVFWKTFDGTFESDDQIPLTLQHYGGRRVKAHCETIADIINDPKFPHHVRRPKAAAINAVRMFLDCAERYDFIADVAHISSVEELDLVKEYRRRGVPCYAELTPQAVTLNHESFKVQTGRETKWGQQNPPLRSLREMLALRRRAGEADYFGTDHAPHTKEEKEKGISGMPQADTAGQVYLTLVDENIISLGRYIGMRSIVPGEIIRGRGGRSMGQLKPGYDASFTLLTRGKPSRIRDSDVLSKCGWTPYSEMEFQNTIEGVVVEGTLYTEAALKNLR